MSHLPSEQVDAPLVYGADQRLAPQLEYVAVSYHQDDFRTFDGNLLDSGASFFNFGGQPFFSDGRLLSQTEKAPQWVSVAFWTIKVQPPTTMPGLSSFAEDRPPTSNTSAESPPIRMQARQEPVSTEGAAGNPASANMATPSGRSSAAGGSNLNPASAIVDMALAAYMSSVESDSGNILLRSHDAAYADYAIDRLLLDAAHGATAKADQDEVEILLLNAEDERFESFVAAEGGDLNADDALANEGVDRERNGVDGVLRGLHDLSAAFEKHGGSNHSQDEVASRGSDWTIGFPESTGQGDELPRHVFDEGGMVLLAAIGDANTSDYDLSAANIVGDWLDVDAGLEASVGIYQAFDAAVEDGPITANDDAPVIPAEAAKRRDDAPLPNEQASSSQNAAYASVLTFTVIVTASHWRRKNKQAAS